MLGTLLARSERRFLDDPVVFRALAAAIVEDPAAQANFGARPTIAQHARSASGPAIPQGAQHHEPATAADGFRAQSSFLWVRNAPNHLCHRW
jgi:hypothetical protein